MRTNVAEVGRHEALDGQQVEALGRSRLKASLIEDGLEVATPERDAGIDLIAYRCEPSGVFLARPIQMKAATDFSISIDRKYKRIPNLVFAFVMDVRNDDHEVFAMTYEELLRLAEQWGWTKTDSWTKNNGYTRTRSSKKIEEALRPFKVVKGSWWRFFEA